MRTLSTSLSLALIAFTLSSLLIPSASSASVDNFELHMVGESPLTDSQGRYRMVAGIWHQMDVYLDSPADTMDIEMRFGNFSEKNFTNYYHWRYSNGNWIDVEYGIYIEPETCERTGTLYSFFIGMDGKLNYGQWNLTINADGSEVYNTQIDVEKPDRGISVSGEFVFRAEPFTPGIIGSNDHLIVRNGGNIPLYYSITFSSFSDRINLTGKQDVIHVNGGATHYIEFMGGSWSPRIIKITGTVTAGGLYRIPTNTTAALISQVASTFPITIYIGHSGYDITEENGFTIQRKREILLDYKAEAELRIFLTGNGTAKVDIRGDNCTVEEVIYNGKRRNLPFSVVLSESQEENITIKIRGDIADTTAKLLYIVEYNGNESMYFTNVKVGSAPPPEPAPPTQPDKTIAAAFIIGTAALATVYILITQKKAAEKVKNERKKDHKKAKLGKNAEKRGKKGGRKG